MKNRILGFALTCSIVLTSFGGVVFAAEKKAAEFTENFETNASTRPNEAFETENAAVFSSENNYTVRQDDYRKHGGGYSLKFSRTSAEPLTISNAFSAVSKGQSPDRIEVSVWLEAEQLSDGGKNRAVSVTAEIVTDQGTAASSEVLVNTDNDFNNSHEGFEEAVFSFDIKDASILDKAELSLVIGDENSYPTIVYMDDLKITGYADEQTAEAVKEPAISGLMRTLKLDNVMTRGYVPGKELTRGDFADILAGILKTSASSQEIKFDDVYELHYAYLSIKSISERGIMNGTGADTFEPDKPITHMEALCTLVRALGYERLAKEKGGYPTGYLSVARSVNLYPGSADDTALTEEAAAQLLLNFVKTNLLEMLSLRDDGYNHFTIEYSDKGSKTILEQNFGIKYGSGILTANDVTSLDGEASSDNTAVIGERQLSNAANADVYSALGRQVDYWYKDGDANYSVLVYLYVSDNNKELIISSDDYSGLSGSSIKYLDGNKERAVNIYKCTFVYNGKVRIFDSSLLNDFPAGKITLVDNDKGGGYDVMLLDKYEYYVVRSVDSVAKTISDEYARPQITIKDDIKTIIKAEDGKPIALSDIKNGDLLRVLRQSAEAADFLEITVIKSQASGSVQAVNNGGGADSVTVNGETYELAEISKSFVDNQYINPLKVGGDITLLLDGNKAVTWLINKGNRLLTGYITKGTCGGVFSKEYTFRILTEYGELETLTCGDKIKLNGVSGVIVDSSDFTNALLEDGHVKEQLIRYRVGGKGLITEIQTAEDYLSGQTVMEKDKLVKVSDSIEGLFLRRGITYFHSGGSGGGGTNIASNSMQYSVMPDAKFFIVPERGGKYENNDSFYRVVGAGDLADYQSTYTPKGYTISGAYNQLDYLVIQKDNTGTAVNNFKATPAVITDVAVAIDEDDEDSGEILNITCVTSNTKVTFKATYDTPPAETDNYYFDWHRLGAGDIILYQTDNAGKVDLYNHESTFYFMLDYNEETKKLSPVYKNLSASSSGYMGRVAGEYGAWFNALMSVHMIKDGYVYLNFEENKGSDECNASYPYDKFKVWVFDTERGKLYEGDISEATQYIDNKENASSLYVSVTEGNPVSMIVYK